MKQYEYKVMANTFANPAILEDQLNILGKHGWELVDVENFDVMGLLIFKRETQ